MTTAWISIAVSIIGLALTIITIVIGQKKSSREAAAAQAKMAAENAAAQARTEEQIKELTRAVRKHNNFAERMPVVEREIKSIWHVINEEDKQ